MISSSFFNSSAIEIIFECSTISFFIVLKACLFIKVLSNVPEKLSNSTKRFLSCSLQKPGNMEILLGTSNNQLSRTLF